MHDGSVFFIELWNHHLIAGCATYRDFLELAEVTLNGTDIGGLVTLKKVFTAGMATVSQKTMFTMNEVASVLRSAVE